jgi:hypothetical protein
VYQDNAIPSPDWRVCTVWRWSPDPSCWHSAQSRGEVLTSSIYAPMQTFPTATYRQRQHTVRRHRHCSKYCSEHYDGHWHSCHRCTRDGGTCPDHRSTVHGRTDHGARAVREHVVRSGHNSILIDRIARGGSHNRSHEQLRRRCAPGFLWRPSWLHDTATSAST